MDSVEKREGYVVTRTHNEIVVRPIPTLAETLLVLPMAGAAGLFWYFSLQKPATIVGAVLLTVAVIGLLLRRSSIVIRHDRVEVRMGFVWRRVLLSNARSASAVPSPKPRWSFATVELDDGTKKRVSPAIRPSAAARVAELICERLGVESHGARALREIEDRPALQSEDALVSTADALAAVRGKAPNPLVALHGLFTKRWSAGDVEQDHELVARLRALGFRPLGKKRVMAIVLPIPITASAFVSEDGAVVAEIVGQQGYHLLSLTTAPMVRWTWSKAQPTTQSSEFVSSAATEGSVQADYAQHLAWLDEQRVAGHRIARVESVEDVLAINDLYDSQFVSTRTALIVLSMPLLLLLPFALVALTELAQ